MIDFLKSVFKSIWKAIVKDPEVQRLKTRHPRLLRFIKNRFTPDERFGLHLTLGVFATLIFVFLFFGVLQDYIGKEALIEADLRVINLVQIFRSPGFNNAMLAVTDLGKGNVVVLGAILLVIALALLKKWRYLSMLVFSVAGGEGFVWVIKHLVKRPRPPLINALVSETSYSFPSGHAFVAVAFYGLLAYLLIRWAKNRLVQTAIFFSAVFLIAAIGFSRIYLGAHWPSDVFASYASGFAWITIIITALEVRQKSNHLKNKKRILSRPAMTAVGTIFFVVWVSYYWVYWKNHLLVPPQNFAGEITDEISCSAIVEKGFEKLPRLSETITGKPMEPINVIVVGSEKTVEKAFVKAGWVKMDQINWRTLWRMGKAAIFGQSYPEAPGTPSFWNTEPNDFAFEKPTADNKVTERHHVHFWKTPVLCDKKPVWYGTAHFDKKIKRQGIIPTHMIDPAVDKERNNIKENLSTAGEVKNFYEFQIVEPTLGSNYSGDLFFTDGEAYVLELKDI